MQPSFTVGDTWEYRNYQIGTGAVNRTWVEVVTQTGDGFVRIRRTDSTGQPASEENITVSDIYNWPLFVGKTWTQPIARSGNTVGRMDIVVEGWESVSTAAGTFEAVRLKNAFEIPEGAFRQVVWYAPAVRHIVRLYYLDKAGVPEQGTELTRFAVHGR